MKASDWISVKDRLPRNNEYVLTSNGIGVWCCLQMFSNGIWIAYDGRTDYTVTHWQRIVLPKDIAQSDDNDDNTIIDKIFNWLDNVDFDMEYWNTVDGFCKEKFINDLKKAMN